MRLLITFNAVIILLTGCVSPQPAAPTAWAKPGASYEQFSADRFDCIQRTPTTYQSFPNGLGFSCLNAGAFHSCMNMRGWTESPNGFRAEPNQLVNMC